MRLLDTGAMRRRIDFPRIALICHLQIIAIIRRLIQLICDEFIRCWSYKPKRNIGSDGLRPANFCSTLCALPKS